MADRSDLVNLIKIPILIALAVTVVRSTVEAFGAPTAVSMILGVAWLHMLFPVYFAMKILDLGFKKPFVTLIKTTVMWAVPVRAAVAITYVLGYIYQIDSLRFQTESLGPVGEGVTPLEGYLLLPLLNFGSWMIGAVILAAITGGITLRIRSRITSQN
jgi:hypothetical protein